LDHSGFKLVDCPTRGSKETVDKKIIVDLMCFAHGHLRGPGAVTVVLISGDGDYSYMLSRLRDLSVRTVVIFPEHRTLPVALLNAAEVKLSWKGDVLRLQPRASPPDAQAGATEAAGTPPGATAEEPQTSPSEPPSEEDSRSQMNEGRGDVFLECVRSVQRLAAQEEASTAYHLSWALDTRVAQGFYENYGAQGRGLYAAHRNTALFARYVERRPGVRRIELRLTLLGLRRVDPEDALPEPLPDVQRVAGVIWRLADARGGAFRTTELGTLYAGHPEYKAVIDAHGGPKKFCQATASLMFLAGRPGCKSDGVSEIHRLTTPDAQ